METIQFKLEENGKGSFFVDKDGERLAEMVIKIAGKDLVVYHTEVSEKLKGQNVAKQLLNDMVDYARKHELKVIALCKFVELQFMRHPDLYADVWKKLDD